MRIQVAVLDACVLYPPALRDLFMWLAVDMVYQPRWTNQIHDEWIRNVKKESS
jgi:23S rRNA C2498 (ribose-2'-O)-methylase RlmM